MANEVKVKATLDERGVTSGVRRLKLSLDEVKRADEGLGWKGVKDGEGAARSLGASLGTAKGAAVALAAGGVAVLAGSLGSLAGQVVEIGQGFEASMSKVAALSGATGDELAQLEAKARELGATTTFSASQAADALGYMALAGWDTQQMLEGVGSVLTLAQAGEMDLAAASDLVTDYLSAFNMEASDTARMVDVLAYAQANANTTVEGLGQAFKNCAANCNAAGMDVETTSAAIAMMANQGLKGSEAGTALNAVMRDMTARMQDGAIAIGEASVEVMDAQGNYRDFADILADVEAATSGMGEAEKAAALQSTFTADSIKGLNLMLNAGAGELVGFRDELYSCAGTAEATAKTMTDNLGGDMAALASAAEELALKLYEGVQGPLRSLAQMATNVAIPAVTALVENFGTVGPALAGAAAGIALVANSQRILSTASKASAAAQSALKAALSTTGAQYSSVTKLMTASGPAYVRYNAQTKAATMLTGQSTAAIRAQQAALKAQAVAMKAGAVAARALGTALKSIAPVAILSIAVSALSALADSISRSREEARQHEQATRGLEAAATGMAGAVGQEADAFAGLAQAASAASLDELREAHASLADSIVAASSQANASASLLQQYGDAIGELAGRADLSEPEVAKLKMAVQGLNDATGGSYSVSQDAAGAYQVMADGAVVAKDAINGLVEAQRLQIQMEAKKASYAQAYAQLEQDSAAYADSLANVASKQEALNARVAELKASGMERYWVDQAGNVHDWAAAEQQALDQATGDMEGYKGLVDSAQSSVNRLEEAQVLLTMAQAEGASELTRAIASNQQWQAAIQSCGASLVDFTAQLGEMGFTASDLAAIMQEQGVAGIQGMAMAYQGGTEELAAWCAENGVRIPEAMAAGMAAGKPATDAASADAAAGVQGNLDGIDGYGPGSEAMGGVGAGIADGAPGAAGQAQGAASQVAAPLEALPSQASTWGAHLMENFASGIGSRMGAAIGKAASAAAAVAANLKFSVPKKGPFSGSERGGETSGRHLMENFARGMGGGIALLEREGDRAASAVEGRFAAMGKAARSSLDAAIAPATAKGIAWRATGGVYNGMSALGLTGPGDVRLSVAMPAGASAAAAKGGSTVVDQTINFNQPVRTPYDVERMMRRYATYGLAGARR